MGQDKRRWLWETGEKKKLVCFHTLLPSRQQPHYLDIVSCVQGRGETQHGGQKHLGEDSSTLGSSRRWAPERG
jgi:hypothetical protein